MGNAFLPMRITMKEAIITSHVAFGLIVIAVICCRVIYNGKYLKGFFRVWLFYVVYCFVFSVVVPGLVAPFNKDLAIDAFPESISIVPSFFLGWFPSMIFIGIAALIRQPILHFKPSLLKAEENPPE